RSSAPSGAPAAGCEMDRYLARSWSGPPATCSPERWHLKGMRCLVGAGNAQEESVAVEGGDSLQADGKALGGKSARNVGGRLARKVEGIAERGPVDPSCLGVGIAEVLANRQCRHGYGRGEQHVVAGKERIGLLHQLGTLDFCADQVDGADACAPL